MCTPFKFPMQCADPLVFITSASSGLCSSFRRRSGGLHLDSVQVSDATKTCPEKWTFHMDLERYVKDHKP
ncbi:hypothetical protein Hanom_Chr02g00137511 [Helianthus anomalus]